VHVDPRYASSRVKLGGGGALSEVSRLGKLAQAGGTSTGAVGVNVARLVTHHRFRKGEGVVRKEKEGGRGRRPYEDSESRCGLVARTS